MTRRLAVLLCAAAVAFAGWAFAQEPGGDDLPEPPVKLKRKQRLPADAPKDEKMPPVEGKKDDAKKDDAKKDDAPKDKLKKDDDDLPDDGDMPEEDEKEILNRVGKNMRLSEDRLANKELGEGTRQVQDDILKDLDKLIQKSQQPPQGGEDQQPQGGGGGGQQDQQPNGGKQAGGQRKQGGGQMRMRQGQGQGEQQANGRRQRGQRGRQQMARGSQGQAQEPAHMGGGNNPGGGGNNPNNRDPNKIADLYKDLWGSLPEKMRAEMNAYGRVRFMTKYEELIRRYYTTAAEKSRKKGE